ncbi:MAG: DNA-binding protein YbiB [Burkholderiales bacterium]|nr:DNA-binding protein YbiB [Burkholderiales bacterium]
MSISAYIKVIGRGKDGARPLSSEQAYDLMSQVLDGHASDLEIGAFCLAMRIKGETVEELDGFVRATLERTLMIAGAQSGVVVLPSYNGARKLPNLTPLLALQLARQGIAVLVHGPRHDPTRVTTAQVFDALGLPTAKTINDVQASWHAGRPAYMDTATLCPPLARLLDVRWAIGLRNPGHTVAKLLDPIVAAPGRRTMRVVNHTHPEYALSLTAYLAHARANALLMRGTEGEPVADPRRQPRFDVFIDGQRDEHLSRAPVDGVLTELPELPNGFDAPTTAQYIEAIMREQQPLAAAIAAQAVCLRQALDLAPLGS